MIIIVSYDVKTISVGGTRRLRRVARICQDYGQRVQFSVFEINLDYTKWISVKQRLLDEINIDEDSLRFYYIKNNTKNNIEHFGQKPSIDFDDTLIV